MASLKDRQMTGRESEMSYIERAEGAKGRGGGEIRLGFGIGSDRMCIDS